MPEDRSNNLTNITKPKRRISEPFIITTCTKTEGGTTYGTSVEQTVIQLAPFDGIPIPESGKIGNRKPVSPTLTTNPLYTVPSYSHLACGSRRFFRVYLGVRTCEHFLCVAPFVFLGSIVFTSLFSLFTSPVSLTGSYTEVEPFFRRVNKSRKKRLVAPAKTLFTWSGGPRSSGVGFFCFHALGDTKQKKPTPLDRGPPLHVNRP